MPLPNGPGNQNPVLFCQQLLWHLVKQGTLNCVYTKIGKWWDKQSEINIVSGCKYWDRKVGYETYTELLAKAQKVLGKKNKRSESFIIFSKRRFFQRVN
ncbi:DUF234 domain-containing protein [Carboxydothermus pertinax]|uniref:ATPase n=1 Tax=Carboxydothermus pertinax TaxID=870242 RepID=A0A1L8CVE8_9THEO|nr:ATPase [Carboxydothermus pertinax]